jgi:hypothetical protein
LQVRSPACKQNTISTCADYCATTAPPPVRLRLCLPHHSMTSAHGAQGLIGSPAAYRRLWLSHSSPLGRCGWLTNRTLNPPRPCSLLQRLHGHARAALTAQLSAEAAPCALMFPRPGVALASFALFRCVENIARERSYRQGALGVGSSCSAAAPAQCVEDIWHAAPTQLSCTNAAQEGHYSPAWPRHSTRAVAALAQELADLVSVL